VLIPSLYATSLRTQSLRLDRFPSDQNTRWRLPFYFSPLRDNEFLVSPHLPDLYPYMRVEDRRDAAHVRQNGDSAGDLVDLALFCLVFFLWFYVCHF
jgi:hypothetical protein